MPKGFGKNYFSLTAIQATSNAVTLAQTSVRVRSSHLYSCVHFEEDECEEELDELLCIEPSETSSHSASHCNCHYRRYTSRIIKQCPHPISSYENLYIVKPAQSPPRSLQTQQFIYTDKEPF